MYLFLTFSAGKNNSQWYTAFPLELVTSGEAMKAKSIPQSCYLIRVIGEYIEFLLCDFKGRIYKMLWLLICRWEAALEVLFMDVLEAHIASWKLIYFKIWGRNRPKGKPRSTQGGTTYCVGSLPEWITGNCSASVLRLISQPIYFKSSHEKIYYNF